MIQVTPNLFAFAALLAWPVVSLYLFATRPVSKALVWTILGGYLLLPVGTVIKFAMIPGFDKHSIPSLAALLGCLLIARKPPTVPKRFGIAEVLIAALLVGPFITSEFNGDALLAGGQYGSFVIPGVGHYDALSASVSQLIVLLPFFLGRRFLGKSEDSSDILRILALAGLLYTIPMLFEVRMSPQLHAWIYGYFPHSFEQQMRDGGFRPVVFLGHGLPVAFFGMTAILASAALWKTGARVLPMPPAVITGWLSATLLLCKSLGSFVYVAALAPVILLTKPRFQVRLAAVLVSIALTYPMMRTMDLFPSNAILDAAGAVSADRQVSLKVRFDQEKMLLEHASERPWFGWGRFGRGRVYDETGKDISITDGHWIITMTTFGIFGFVAEFGLMAYIVFRSIGSLSYTKSARDQISVAAITMIVAIGLVDLLPNATISPWSWLLAGALLGRIEGLAVAVPRKAMSERSAQHDAAIRPSKLGI